MSKDKILQTGNTSMLILKLIEEKDMYGYEMIETLQKRSDNTFSLKAGTLYPLLSKLEEKGFIECYEKTAETGRVRKYYKITSKGKVEFADKKAEWTSVSTAINKVIGGACVAKSCYNF